MVITSPSIPDYFYSQTLSLVFYFSNSSFAFSLINHGTILLNCRAEYTKYIVTPTLGVSGVGAAMAVYGACDAIVSMQKQIVCTINWFSGDRIEICTFLGSYELYLH